MVFRYVEHAFLLSVCLPLPLGSVHTKPDSFCAASKIVPDRASLVPRPVRAIRVTRGGLEPSAIARGVLGECLTGDVTSEIAEDDWERGWDKASVHTQERFSGAISVTERSCTALIWKVERHILGRFCHNLVQCEHLYYSARRESK